MASALYFVKAGLRVRERDKRLELPRGAEASYAMPSPSFSTELDLPGQLGADAMVPRDGGPVQQPPPRATEDLGATPRWRGPSREGFSHCAAGRASCSTVQRKRQVKATCPAKSIRRCSKNSHRGMSPAFGATLCPAFGTMLSNELGFYLNARVLH